MPTQSSLPSALLRSARSYAGQITSMARSLAPAHLRDNISTHVTEEGEGTIRITTKVTAPDAHAQEYGSGLNSQRGVKAKYPIVPKAGKYLAFNWEIANSNPDNFSFLPDGRVLLNKVMHPGIKAVNSGKGYLRPTYLEFRKKLRGNSELNNAIHKAIVSDIRRSFQGNK